MTAMPVFLMLILMAIGLPVAFAMGISGIIGLGWVGGVDSIIGVLSTSPYRSAAHYTLTTVPLFILMAEFVSQARITRDVFDIAYKWLGHLPGGVAVATVFADACFGAMCGSSTAAAAAMSSVVVPEMQRLKYDDRLSGGVVAVAGTLAILIPPSVPMIIYGSVTETSVGKLLIAGLIPGILMAIALAAAIVVWAKYEPAISPKIAPFSWKERMASLKSIWAILLLFASVIGCIYFGIATPTESAGIGASGALIIGLFMRRLNFQQICDALVHTLKSTSMIFTLIIGAMIFGYYATMTQIPQHVIQYIGALAVNRWVIMAILVVIYLILGCLMDQIAILLLTLPVTFPLVMSLGYDPIWFGVVIVVLVEIGLCTPPVGLNVFIVSSISKIPLETVFKGVFYLLSVMFAMLLVLMAFPQISLFMPSRM